MARFGTWLLVANLASLEAYRSQYLGSIYYDEHNILVKKNSKNSKRLMKIFKI